MKDSKRFKLVLFQYFLILLLMVQASVAFADSGRTVVFISDLHMGIGKDGSGKWYPTEDFRWPRALEGFLKHISNKASDKVDLVIVGDFLELWQPPPQVKCEGPNDDYGCSVSETIEIVKAVVDGHAQDFKAFANFAQRGTNCIHVIPGNHDASLMLDEVWNIVATALEADRGCIKRVDSGRWMSADGRIAAEHGHQIGWDPNRYSEWPEVSATIDGKVYIRRPWGERFVQKIFNDTEAEYPLIDNLSPNSAGAKYRIQSRSLLDNASDIAQFLKFNLMETSLTQKVSILGKADDPDAPPKWDIPKARLLGADLFLQIYAADGSLTGALEDQQARRELASALNLIAADSSQMTDDEVLVLCDHLAALEADKPCPTVDPETLGYVIAKVVPRERVVGPYVEKIQAQHKKLRVFVYGHTHAFEKEWEREINSLVSVSILNDGAFLRLIDDEKFQVQAKRYASPGEALQKMALDELPACYTFVRVTESMSGSLQRELLAWHMEETGSGKPIDPCHPACANVGNGCK